MNEVEILFHDGWKHIVRKLLARNDLELSVEAGYRQSLSTLLGLTTTI